MTANLFPAEANFRDGLSQLVEVTLNNEDEDVRLAGIDTLTSLAKSGTFMQLHLINPILTAFSDIIRPYIKSELTNKSNKLSGDEYWIVRMHWIELLTILIRDRMPYD